MGKRAVRETIGKIAVRFLQVRVSDCGKTGK